MDSNGCFGRTAATQFVVARMTALWLFGEIPSALARDVGLRALQAHRLISILISFHQTLMQFRQWWVKTRQLGPKIPVF